MKRLLLLVCLITAPGVQAQTFATFGSIEKSAVSGNTLADSIVQDSLSWPLFQLLAEANTTALKSQERGSGALAFSVTLDERATWTTFINVVSVKDSLTSDLGRSILPPRAGNNLESGLLDFVYNPLVRYREDQNGKKTSYLLRRTGIHLYGSINTTAWEATPDSARQLPGEAQDVAVLGGGALAQVSIVEPASISQEKAVSLRVEAGLSYRLIAGDAGQDADFRRRVLGASKRAYVGLEMGLQARYGPIVAALQYYLYPAPSERHVRGLTNGQLVAGISLQGALDRWHLRKRVSAER